VGTLPDPQPGLLSPYSQQRHTEAFVTGGAYSVLFLLGAMEGLIGCFQYSRAIGPVPVAAFACCAGILATCVAGGWAMRTLGGALGPALGWILASFVLAMPNPGGSVVITNTGPGKWYLYGGAACAAVGAAITLVSWTRAQAATASEPPAAGTGRPAGSTGQ
jgi:hypothetical protein